MEDILSRIIKDVPGTKFPQLRQTALEAITLLSNQFELMRAEPYQLREICLFALQLALESKSPKLISHAVKGFQEIVQDKSFQASYEGEEEEKWLPSQLVKALASGTTLSDDVQLDLLKIMLQLAYSSAWYLSVTGVLNLLGLYQDLYSQGSAQVKTASLATASQTLQAYTAFQQEVDEQQQKDTSTECVEDEQDFAAILDDILPILTVISQKLVEHQSACVVSLSTFWKCGGKKGATCRSTPFHLQCTLVILRSLQIDVHTHEPFIKFLWQELCPALVSLLGRPQSDCHISSNSTVQTSSKDKAASIGRGSGSLAITPSYLSANTKSIYDISLELVRLVGNVGSLRPVLASLFHRMILYPATQHRLGALRALRELFSKPELVVNLSGPPLYDDNDKNNRHRDLDLYRIATDCLLECCHSPESSICCTAVSCALSLVSSMEVLVEGQGITEAQVSFINSIYTTLNEAEADNSYERRKDSTSAYGLDNACVNHDINVPMPCEKNKENCLTFDDFDSAASTTDEEEDVEIGGEEEEEQVEKCDTLENENDTSKIPLETEDNHNYSKQDDCDSAENLQTVGSDINKNEHISSESFETGVSEENADKKDNDETMTETVTELKRTCAKSIGSQLSVYESTGDSLDSLGTDAESESKITVIRVGLTNGSVENDNDSAWDAEDSQSMSSGITEGPEEDFDLQELQRELEAEEREQVAMEQARRDKAPRTLLADEDGREERARAERLCLQQDSFAKCERHNASLFVHALASSLPRLLSLRTSVEADQALQEFASNYCEETWQKQHSEHSTVGQPVTILNADGIYLATYSSLLLNIKLIRTGYFPDFTGKPALSESSFIEEVHGSGVLVYLSATWLSEVYQQLLHRDLLLEAGYNPHSENNSALINLLSDIDGLGSTEQGGQLLSDYRRLERAVSVTHCSPNRDAGMKLVRVLFTSSFNVLLEVLSVLLNGTNDCGVAENLGLVLGTEGAKEEQRRTKEAVSNSLEGLQKTAKLCNLLGLQNFCGAVFEQLALASCPPGGYFGQNQAEPKHRKQSSKALLPWSGRSLHLHTSHVMSLEIIMAKGLELASHSPLCWRHLFRCCLYVMTLEHSYFSVFSNTSSHQSKPYSVPANRLIEPKDNSLNLPSFDAEDYGEITSSVFPAEQINLLEVVKSLSPQGGLIRDKQLKPVVEGLSQLVDRFFEDSSSMLNLSALIRFLAELCAASQEQLFAAPPGSSKNRSLWWRTLASRGSLIRESARSGEGQHSLLLMHRVSDVMLRCSRGGRPLLHVMKAWSIAAPHFVEAACHKDQAISRKAVASIHDVVSALLSSHPELAHFHCNEALFKPFENLLCLELCDTDVQEQIIGSICEFVESCTVEVRSGWRPLFGALRAVRLPAQQGVLLEADQARYLRVVLDVFNAFLGTQNTLVFANAAIDCLLCLLKHVKGPVDGTYESESVNDGVPLDLCLAALKYLERCSSILGFLFQMPACPVFSSANRIQLQKEPAMVDSSFLDAFLENEDYPTIIISVLNEKWEAKPLRDDHSGILSVWFLLLEGLVGSVAVCPKRYQTQTIQMLFGMLNKVKDVPGIEFGVHSVNHLLLPMLQSWLRKSTGQWEDFTSSFKQCCGLTTDLIGDYLLLLSDKGQLNEVQGVRLMLYQLFLVLIECISKSVESISRLGCACIRHILNSVSHTFPDELWEITCWALRTASWISLRGVQQLCHHFCTGSQNFYGDVGQVKVAARTRDDKPQDVLRLNQLAQQVFLLESQMGVISATDSFHEERAFVFLLSTEQEDMHNITRVPFDSLVIGLMSHQLLLQSISTLFLAGSHFSLPGLSLPTSSPFPNSKTSLLPGLLSHLSECHRTVLLDCLRDSYSIACEFDCRPGLKFLVQKVSGWPVAANLYRQAGMSWSVCILTLLELCLSKETNKKPRTLEATNQVIGVHPSFPGEKNMSPLVQLRECLMEMSSRYCDLAMQKEEGYLLDKVAAEPVFFLSLKEDDLTNLCPALALKANTLESSPDVAVSKEEAEVDESQSFPSGEEVYRVATQGTIQGMVSEYKRRKNQHTLPTASQQVQHNHRNSKSSSSSDSSIPEDIHRQRENSILKDSEAHEQVLTQLLQSVLEQHLSMEGDEDQFGCMLPVFFPAVQTLVAQAQDPSLRATLAHWLHRLALHCGILLPPCQTPES